MDHKQIRDNGQGASLLDVALDYHQRGWSIIPIQAGTKKPACRSVKRYQTERADERTLRRWFANGKNHGQAVICGPVSGGLVARDFDTMEAYERWTADHPELARTLPTVRTARGRHVYFRADFHKTEHLDSGTGELRGKGYCLLPPSQHPSGVLYEWLIPFPDGELPFIDNVIEAGFLLGNVTERTEITETTEENRGLQRITHAIVSDSCSAFFEEIPDDIQRAILETLPQSIGHRNRDVFELARALLAIPYLADADPVDMEAIVQRWHDLGIEAGVIGTEPFEETWTDFLICWPKVKFPKGQDPMTAIFEKAQAADLPQAALRYEQPKLRLLVALCRELQRAAGDGVFFLSCRTAAKVLDLKTARGEFDHVKTWRWLSLLQKVGILLEVQKGDQVKRLASRYRYVGD